jgi:hypothetical protein
MGETSRAGDTHPAPAGRRWRWFFPLVSGALLSAVLLGFAPTFYLRPLFTARPLPAYLYAHGTVLTAWFALMFAQTCLVAARRTDLHRRLGVVAVGDAALVAIFSGVVAIRAVPRYIAGGVDAGEIQLIVIGDLVSLAVFCALVVAAVRMRRRPDWHKRLMAVASVMIIGPAIARLERLGLAVPVPAAILAPLLALAVYDRVGLGRLHPATLWSSLLVVVAVGAVFMVVGTPTGRALIDLLR